MVAHDISRHLFRPAHHYTGLRMQQGRVSLDSDFNEARMLDDEGQRLFVRDVIGPHGTPDDGFKIGAVTPTPYDFPIAAGTYYLGGLRHEIVGTSGPLSPQSFLLQSDWEQVHGLGTEAFPAQPPLPKAPTLTEGPRHDLVYLLGWEQGVTSVEDAELREQAIAAQDTGYRIRRMHRVNVRSNTPADCSAGFDALVTALELGGHAFDRVNHELLSGGRLKIGAAFGLSLPTDLCTPPALHGYSGAENETIRVQLLGNRRFLWGYDNASPLYRVRLSATEVDITVTFSTKPRDAAHQPRVGQVLEIVPCGARLSNGEHVADHPLAVGMGHGLLARVVTPYEPATGTVTVVVADAPLFTAMLAPFGEDPTQYVFARVWNPGDRAGDDSTDPLLDTTIGAPYEPGVAVRLLGTGLTVTFTADGIVGDHWIVAARPATTRDVVPWNLATGVAPHGPRRFYSPLAIVHWSFVGSDPVATVHDCRPRVRPLTRIRGCCTVSVGDGNTSFGDYSKIGDAIAAIPIGEPGKICVLPGVFDERVTITGRSDLVIEGCGARTLIRTPAGNTTAQGVLSLLSCTNITVRSLRIDATGQIGVMSNYSGDVTLEQLDITTRRDPAVPVPAPGAAWDPTLSSPFPRSTIAFANGSGLTVEGCKLTMIGDVTAAANLTIVRASSIRVGNCEITSTPRADGRSHAWSGIYFSDVSRFVVTGSRIAGGVGHGITFGIRRATSPDPLGWFDSGTHTELELDDDCPGIRADLPLTAAPAGGGTPVTLVPSVNTDGAITGNRISGMGGSGISVLGFWPESTPDYPMIETHDLVIADNIIVDNYRSPAHGPMPLDLLDVVAFGGVSLAAADRLRIHDNRIEGNGLDFRSPVCGIHVLHGENITIENNLIRGNGPRIDDAALYGIRAGIALQMVGRRVVVEDEELEVGRNKLLPAAVVRGNTIQQPAGRALQLYGIGPMFVEGNTLISEGLTSGWTALVPHCVDIQNIGLSPELILEALVPAAVAIFPAPPLLYDGGAIDPLLIDGRILFTDNQVRFAPVTGTAADIFCATRLQSYGDVGVLDNQFLALFPSEGGTMFNDTIVTAWSTRTNNNRWEDPIGYVTAGSSPADTDYDTYASATTLAYLNFTTFNQASRCIHAVVTPGAASLVNPTAVNQIYTYCDGTPPLTSLLLPP